jgi:predicted nucleic acid-binding protein
MTFGDVPAGASLFLDANTFIFCFGPDPVLGPPCEQLLERIEQKEFSGFTSAHVLSEVAHRLMALEACSVLGWPHQGIAQRLRRNPAEVQKLTRYIQAIDEISQLGVQILPILGQQVSLAADMSRQTGLLSSDALVVTVMQTNGLTHLASHDADFDRVPGLTRYAPV